MPCEVPLQKNEGASSMLLALIVIEVCIAAGAQLLLRHGAMNFAHDGLSLSLIVEPLRNLSILGGLVLHGVGFFLYVYILSKLQLNVFYPVATGATIVLVALLSVALLRESLGLAQFAGIAAIVIGIFLVFQTS
jgi:multidrug transporter EmrE-like cation transporter